MDELRQIVAERQVENMKRMDKALWARDIKAGTPFMDWAFWRHGVSDEHNAREAAWDKMQVALQRAGRSPLEAYVEANRHEAGYRQAAAEDHASRVDHHQQSELAYHTRDYDYERSK